MEAFSLPLIVLAIIFIVVWGLVGQRAAARAEAAEKRAAEHEEPVVKTGAPRPDIRRR